MRDLTKLPTTTATRIQIESELFSDFLAYLVRCLNNERFICGQIGMEVFGYMQMGRIDGIRKEIHSSFIH